MKFDPCTCSADSTCTACRELEALFTRAERDALLELGRATYESVQMHKLYDWKDIHDPGE